MFSKIREFIKKHILLFWDKTKMYITPFFVLFYIFLFICYKYRYTIFAFLRAIVWKLSYTGRY